ncbi:hypothetical protein ACQPZF_03515 [Actinosynnema sp. CS-041913]|uniref:AbiTii domain-containing protein n=1 Tax=Actinosynnema sp. CS-041913 TaxID=3239917 RepID=UPI003D940BB7
MRKRSHGLIGEIQQGALDNSVSVTTLLRKCLALGGQAQSRALMDWAQKELNGYWDDDEVVPQYRRITAVIAADIAMIHGVVEGQQISALDLPEVAHDTIGDEVRLGHGIAEIEDLANRGETTLLSLPGSSELMRLMNYGRRGSGGQFVRLYWMASDSAFRGVVERIRNLLVQMVAEMMAEMNDDDEVPTKTTADQAVHVVIKGGRRNTITLVNSQAAEGGTSTVTPSDGPAKPDGFWQRLRRRGVVVVLSTVAAAVLAAVTWLEWKPWE